MQKYKKKVTETFNAFQWKGDLADLESCGFYIGLVSQDLGSKDLTIEDDRGIIFTIHPGSWLVLDCGYIHKLTNEEFFEQYEAVDTENSAWLPIETAPKDGTVISIWQDSAYKNWQGDLPYTPSYGYWDSQDKSWVDKDGARLKSANKWMPIPEAPRGK